MIRNLTLAASLLALTTADVSAQRQQSNFPHTARINVADLATAGFRKDFHGRILKAHGNSTAMMKTTSGGQRVIAQTDYDFSSTPGGALADTIFLKYSGNRTSTFDFEYLQYDFGNATDAPGPYNSTSYVHFDSAYAESPAGPLGRVFRTYNANGKVTHVDYDDYMTLFSYDAQGRLARQEMIERNTTTGNFTDTAQRNFYAYNGAGHVVLDSVEQWDPSASVWVPVYSMLYTPDGAGNITKLVMMGYFGGSSGVFLQVDFNYNAANLPVTILTKFDDGTGNLVDVFKDTFGYTGTARVLNTGYEWDMPSSAWTLSYNDIRHLNGASLPDSIWHIEVYNGSIDTSIQKLTYNGQGNPLVLRGYTGKNAIQEYETRWYYQNENNVGISNAPARNSLSVYPNPAGEILYLKGQTEGVYTIQNMAGQVLQKGTLLASAGIPLRNLAPGVYAICVQDKNGSVHTSRFIRK